jgi:DNA repair exonuclease SbcCD ATPase subunit
MFKLREAAESYSKALSVEEDRLGVARWFAERAAEAAGTCPVCGNGFDETHSRLKELLINLESVEKGSAAFRTLPPSFDKEWAEVRQKAGSLGEQIASVQKRIAGLQMISETERSKRYTELHTSRFTASMNL